MVSEDDLFARVRLLRPVDRHEAGEECTLTDFRGEWVMVEFDDGDVGVAVAPADLSPVRRPATAA